MTFPHIQTMQLPPTHLESLPSTAMAQQRPPSSGLLSSVSQLTSSGQKRPRESPTSSPFVVSDEEDLLGAYKRAASQRKEGPEGEGEAAQECWGAETIVGGRPYQEDTYLAGENLSRGSSGARLFAVFDGHGGAGVSKHLQQHAAHFVGAALGAQPGTSQDSKAAAGPEEAMKKAFLALDASLYSSDPLEQLPPSFARDPAAGSSPSAQQQLPSDMGGSTSCVVVLEDNRIICASTGKGGSLKQFVRRKERPLFPCKFAYQRESLSLYQQQPLLKRTLAFSSAHYRRLQGRARA